MIKYFCDNCGEEIKVIHIINVLLHSKYETEESIEGDFCINCIDKVIRNSVSVKKDIGGDYERAKNRIV